MLKNLIAAILPLIFFTACSGGVSATTPTGGLPATAALPAKITLEAVPMILDPTRVPPAPDPAVNDSTVAGIDSNNNGIRDDIERWIAQTYPTSAKMRAAAVQLSLSLQARTISNMNRDTAYQAALVGSRAISCLIRSAEAANQKDRLEDIMSAQMNTRARMSAYYAFQNALGSRLFKSPGSDACDIPALQLPN